MDKKNIDRILEETAYIRTGGSPEERKCAEYIQAECAKFGCQAVLEPFSVPMSTIQVATLTVNGKEIPCKGYALAGNGDVEAELYCLSASDPYALSQCKGKIVLTDRLGYWRYQDLLKHGAVGFITYTGMINYADRDIDQKELRPYVSEGKLLPGVNINVKDAVTIAAGGPATATIKLEQTEYTANSHNVVLDLPGELPEYILLSAHYDTTHLSIGAFDNMSGSIGLLSMAESFSKKPHRYGLRFVWCGSEERGLLGSKAYCAAHVDILESIVMNINLDMLGTNMGSFIVHCSCEEKMVSYIQYFSSEKGVSCTVRNDLHSSDSTSFADKGVPAVSFGWRAAALTATIHERYDTKALLNPTKMVEAIAFIEAFLDRMANAVRCPVAREIPDNIQKQLDEYLLRKRPNSL